MRRLTIAVLAALASATLAPAQGSADPTLTLDDAIRLALGRNKNLKVVSFDRGISRALLLVARGHFDPAIVASRSALNQPEQLTPGYEQVYTFRQDTYSLGLGGQTPLGTTYSISTQVLDQRYSFNGYGNNYLVFAGFQVTQPLLKGFGLAANLENVRVAKANRGISDLQYRQSAIDTVTNVIVAYSNLELAHDVLDAARRSRDAATSLLEANEKEYKVGAISQSDVTTARFNVASQEEAILIAERTVRDRQNMLRELIGDDVFLEDEPLFMLAPMQIPEVTVNLRADLSRALAERPDYLQARLGIVKNREVEAAARNGVLPEVDFVGGYGYNGLGTTLSPSRAMVEQHDNPSYSAGLQVTIPLTFAVGRGNLRAARLQRQQSEEDLRRLEADIAVSVANAAGQIDTTQKRVVADRAAYALAKQALDAEEKKKLVGTSTTLAVVQQQQFVSIQEVNVSYALASERQAVALYDQQLGTTLERYHINLASE
jgi:outer membrane protein TolC